MKRVCVILLVISTFLASVATASSNQTQSWTGIYKVTSKCDTTHCCCLAGDVNVTQVATNAVNLAGPVVGCFPITVISTGPVPIYNWNDDVVSFTWLGQVFTATRSGRDLTVVNEAAPQCRADAACKSGACMGSEPTVHFTLVLWQAILIAIGALLILGLLIAIIVFFIVRSCRRKGYNAVSSDA